MNAFDGAGREYRQSSYKTIVFVGLVIVILIVVVWFGGLWLMDFADARQTPAP